MLSELTRHIAVQGTNEKTEKKQHARLPAQVPASSVSRTPSGNADTSGRTQCQAMKTGNIEQTTARARQQHKEYPRTLAAPSGALKKKVANRK